MVPATLLLSGMPAYCLNRVFAENLVRGWVTCTQPVSYIKPTPTHEKLLCCGEKVAQNANFHPFFLGWVGLALGPWVGEFDGFITTCTWFPTQQKLVNRKHPNTPSRQQDYCTNVLSPRWCSRLSSCLIYIYIYIYIPRSIS